MVALDFELYGDPDAISLFCFQEITITYGSRSSYGNGRALLTSYVQVLLRNKRRFWMRAKRAATEASSEHDGRMVPSC